MENKEELVGKIVVVRTLGQVVPVILKCIKVKGGLAGPTPSQTVGKPVVNSM